MKIIFYGDGLLLEGRPALVAKDKDSECIRVFDHSEFGLHVLANAKKNGRPYSPKLENWTPPPQVGEVKAFGTGAIQVRDRVILGDFANRDHVKALLKERGINLEVQSW